MKNKWPIIITVAASLGLMLLAISYYALYSTRLAIIIFGDQPGLGPQKSSSLVVDDPLITFVPEDKRGENQKTKVFISSQDPMLGTDAAKVYVILYGSLLDYDMQVYVDNVVDLQASYGDDVAIVWKDYTATDIDDTAATIGHCANEVGRFWEYAAALDNQSDLAALETEFCLDTVGLDAIVEQSSALADTLGVTTTHSVFVNDELYVEPISLDDLKTRIDVVLESFE